MDSAGCQTACRCCKRDKTWVTWPLCHGDVEKGRLNKHTGGKAQAHCSNRHDVGEKHTLKDNMNKEREREREQVKKLSPLEDKDADSKHLEWGTNSHGKEREISPWTTDGRTQKRLSESRGRRRKSKRERSYTATMVLCLWKNKHTNCCADELVLIEFAVFWSAGQMSTINIRLLRQGLK